MAAMAAGVGAGEAERAQALIDAATSRLREAGVEPEPLRATLLNGKSVKTDAQGWYLDAAHSVAIGPGGEFYSLVVPGSLMAVFKGVHLVPEPPKLRIGAGARDGVGGDLADLLAKLG
jgi:hypothetical protein